MIYSFGAWTQLIELKNDTERSVYVELITFLKGREYESINKPFVNKILRIAFCLRGKENYLRKHLDKAHKPELKALFVATALFFRLLKRPDEVRAESSDAYGRLLRDLSTEDEKLFGTTLSRQQNVYLLRFAEACWELNKLLPGHRNQKLFLTVCALFENSGRLYATGGAPSLETRRRLKIVSKITGVTPVPKKTKTPRVEVNEVDAELFCWLNGLTIFDEALIMNSLTEF